MVKTLDLAQFDYLFVVVADGRQWFIPAARVRGGTSVLLGGPNYGEFEVDSGDPIPHARTDGAPLQSASRTALGGMSEWLKERGCKPRGIAYAGSNPAPPIPRYAPLEEAHLAG